MKKYKQSIFIIILALSMVGVLIFFTHNKIKSSYKSFISEGYFFVSSNNKNTSEKYYFQANSKYKILNNKNIVFQDINGDKISIGNNSFLHYLNRSIGVLKKSVVLNLDDLETSNVVDFYNIAPGTVLDYLGGNYYIGKETENSYKFQDLLIKIDENKYLITSNIIKLKIDEGEVKNIAGFVELTISDGDIVTIENQEISYKTVMPEAYIEVNNIKIYPVSQAIKYTSGETEETKMYLSQIAIDSDSNVEIKYEEPTTTTTTENITTTTTTKKIIKNEAGKIEEESTIVEITKDIIPTFTISSMEVNANKLNATIDVVDQSNLLDNNIKIKLIENATGKTVYETEENSGKFNIKVYVENLMPETEYTLIAIGEYNIKGLTFSKEFITKTFVSEPVGVTLSKNYFTSTSASFNLDISSYSKVKSAVLKLYNANNELIKNIEVDITIYDDKSFIQEAVLFEDLLPNTTYTAKLTDYSYENAIISDIFDKTIKFKTLKTKPSLGEPTFTIDKTKSLVNIKLNNISDIDSGFYNYRYEVYDAIMAGSGIYEPIVVYESDKASAVNVDIDNEKLMRGSLYAFKVFALFNDNEKTIEYSTELSNPFKIDGVSFPTLAFEEEEITFESIKGLIKINDPGNAVSLNTDKPMRITYTNSLGITKYFTSTGSLNIVFDQDNLRAHETYTISVYASVDMQDGIDKPIDNCFIGSIVVHTIETKPLFLNMTEISEEVNTQVFNLSARLSSAPGIDNTLEASTLTGITFSLYAGQNTTTQPIKTVKKTDLDEGKYSSILKTEYYDNDFVLTPEFFGLENSDLTASYYTITASEAYDYTEYNNNIPIENSVKVVKANGIAPGIQLDVTKRFEINAIKNGSAGEHYDSNFLPNTIAGYKIRANFDNSRSLAKYFVYGVYDAQTNQLIDSKRVDVPSDGSLDYVTFYLEPGTHYDIEDNKFRRGNEYYFAYYAMLDLNFDGTPDTKYPYDGREHLESVTILPLKEEAKMVAYPSISNANSYTWQYKLSDPDKALIENNIYYSINSVAKGTKALMLNEGYQTLTFDNLVTGNLNTFYKEALIKNEAFIKETQMFSQYFESIVNIDLLNTFNLRIESNRVLISISNYNQHENLTNRIAYAEVKFTTNNDEKIISNLQIVNGMIIIPLSDLKDFINKDISASVKLYYDDGREGFELSGNHFALKTILNSTQESRYLHLLSPSNTLSSSNYLGLNLYKRTFNKSDNVYIENYLKESNKRNIIVEVSKQGVAYNQSFITFKGLGEKNLNGDGTQHFNFEVIIPGVSLYDNATSRYKIAPGLIDMEALITFDSLEEVNIKDNSIELDLYETDATGMNSIFQKQITININDLSEVVKVTELEPNKNYYFKLFAYIMEGGSYTRTQLYDIDDQSTEKIYYFRTLNNIGFSNITDNYIAENYLNKRISISYNVNQILGYNKIVYKLYKIINNGEYTRELVDIHIPDDEIFKENMNKIITVPPGSAINYNGTTYEIEMTPVTIINYGEGVREINLEPSSKTFVINNTNNPHFGVARSIVSNNTLNFRVSILDISKIIVNGEYSIKILNDDYEDVTPAEYINKIYSTDELNKTFSLNILNQTSSKYYFVIRTHLDRYNKLESESVSITKEFGMPNETGIYIGDIYANANETDSSKIDLTFYNSYLLTNITSLRYSIYNHATGTAFDAALDFTPVQKTINGETVFTITLDKNLSTRGLHYLELQFIKNKTLAYTESITHNY